MASYDLEKRLISFAVLVIRLSASTHKEYALDHLTKQLIRSATAAALNYGEAQGAESSRDFIHKMRLVLKELKESRVNLSIQLQANLLDSEEKAKQALSECEQLIAIFAKSISTANKKIGN